MGHADDPEHNFGSLVRRYRLEAQLTQRELAAKAGLSVAALRDFEQDRRQRPRPNSLAALSAGLDLNADQADGLARAVAAPRRRPASAPRTVRDQPESHRSAVASGRGHALRLAVLGPLEASKDGAPLSLGPLARRAVLGVLLLDPGTLVRRDTLIDALWGEAPPRTAVGIVQAHVSRLRRLLEPVSGFAGGGRVLDSVGSAYRLTLSCSELDLLAFRDLAARGAAAQAGGDFMAAAEIYAQAIELWRGDPLADVDVLADHPAVTAMKQELSSVLLRYAEVACTLGQPHRVLPRLQALASAEPLNESAHACLILALAGAGQRAAAIGVYEDVRLRLDRELGLYPGKELGEAYLRVLRADIRAGDGGSVVLTAPPLGLPPPAHGAIVNLVPRQLPVAPRGFNGRASELKALSELLESGPSEVGGVVIVALMGMAGIGKTALAVQWAHRVADQFTDGQLFVNLRGFSPSGAPVAPTEAVRGFLSALGVPPERIPADADAQAALYRTLLADRRMFIVLDNARNAEQVRPLLPASPGCLVLVTSRKRLTGLAVAEGAHLITLGPLPDPGSRDLLSMSLGAERTRAEPAAVSELIALCGRLPLALSNTAARAAARPGLSLSALAAEMKDSRSRLDVLQTGESVTSVRMVFSWSRAQLGNQAMRMFRLLGIHPGLDITVSTAASLAGFPRGEASLALTDLCDEHLLTEYSPSRYRLHDLLRAYAAEQARSIDSKADRRAAVSRVLDYYLHSAKLASDRLGAYHIEGASAPSPSGVAREEIDGARQAAEWFENEQLALLSIVRHAAEEGYAPHAWELPWVVGWYFRDQAYWQRIAAAQEAALGVAVELGDLTGKAIACQHLGWLRFLLGDSCTAVDYLDAADGMASELGDGRLRALTAVSRAYILESQNQFSEAMSQVHDALRFARGAGTEGGVHALYAIGWHSAQLHDSQRALTFTCQAITLCCESLRG